MLIYLLWLPIALEIKTRCLRSGIVTTVAQGTAVARVPSLAWELSHAMGVAKKKKKKKEYKKPILAPRKNQKTPVTNLSGNTPLPPNPLFGERTPPPPWLLTAASEC